MAAYDHSRVAHFIGLSSSFTTANHFRPSFHFSGGNSLDKAPVGRVHDFVKVNGGHTIITKVSSIGLSPLFGHTYSK
jgi:acetyl-CoA carboxylase/biotin carboxylase 1